MPETIQEIAEYYTQFYPLPGDNLTADQVAEDAKRLARDNARLRAKNRAKAETIRALMEELRGSQCPCERCGSTTYETWGVNYVTGVVCSDCEPNPPTGPGPRSE